MLPAEVIRSKRDGGTLSRAQIDAFVGGLVDGSWADSQAAALAMAIVLRGMAPAETAALADAMTHSGTVLDWPAAGFTGPVLDKHSTGGVGDKVSLMLAPMLAAAGAPQGVIVPMISGRGLGHTGGTLDKLEALPGYTVDVPHERLLQTLRSAGCAIVGASARLAPADKRLYAIRDVTATVESVPLITASILSKKRAAGLQALVMDVKFGSGAFTPELAQARELARSLVQVAGHAGLPTVALLSDMNQVLGHTAGNALEVAEALDFLTGRAQALPALAVATADAGSVVREEGMAGAVGAGSVDDATGASGATVATNATNATNATHGAREPRLLALTLALGAQLLHLAGAMPTLAAARQALQRSLDDGSAAEHFARMVAALGGPADVLRDAGLQPAPVRRAVPAARSGRVAAVDVRGLGLAVVALGGGRLRPGDRVDPRVGLARALAPGAAIAAGQALAWVHAASEGAAEAAVRAVQAAYTLADEGPAVPAAGAVVRETVTG
jgi:thymidine phosphorylase